MFKLIGNAVLRTGVATTSTNVYGIARTFLAVSMMLTLALNRSAALFRLASGQGFTVTPCSGLRRISLFCILDHHMDLARWIAIVLLAVVASGWRPRFTGVLHWWVSFSFIISATLIDGGDQIGAILALFLIPLTLIDARRWHWDAAPAETSIYARLVAISAWIVIRVQVAVVYLHAGVGKLAVPEWKDGTALYYWLTDPTFGAAEPFRSLLQPLITNPYAVTLMTWSSIAVEVLLFAAFFGSKGMRRVMLVVGISFHAAIGVFLGLTSFSLAMSAALILALREPDRPFLWLQRGAPAEAESVIPVGQELAKEPA